MKQLCTHIAIAILAVCTATADTLTNALTNVFAKPVSVNTNNELILPYITGTFRGDGSGLTNLSGATDKLDSTNASHIGLLTSTLSSADTNSIRATLTLKRQTTGTAGAGIGNSITFYNTDSIGQDSYSAYIASLLTDTTSGQVDTALAFATKENSGTMTERMRIRADGNVGVGKTNPEYPLDVNGAVNATAFIGDGSGLTGIWSPPPPISSLTVTSNGSFGGTVTATNGFVDKSNIKYWGAIPSDGIDDTTAIQLAIDYATTNTLGNHTVYFPAGIYTITNSLNCTAATAQNNRYGVTLVGDGMRRTFIIGGVTGYPIVDFAGSMYSGMKDIAVTTIGTSIVPSCGVFVGRTNVGSAGAHRFERLFVYGNYSVASFYSSASEVNLFDSCIFSAGGECSNNIAVFYCAKTVTNIYSTPIVSRYQTLVDDGTGGNSLNQWINCSFGNQCGSNYTGGSLLIDEFFLGHSLVGCIMTTKGPTNQIILNKAGVGLNFVSTRCEAYNTDGCTYPIGINVIDGSNYKNVVLSSSHVFPIISTNNANLYDWVMEGSYFNGTNSVSQVVLDADRVVDCKFVDCVNPPGGGNYVGDGVYKINTLCQDTKFDGVTRSRLSGVALDTWNISGMLTVGDTTHYGRFRYGTNWSLFIDVPNGMWLGGANSPVPYYKFKVSTSNSVGSISVATTDGTKTGYLFANGGYGYLDYNANTAFGIRLAGLGDLNFGVTDNVEYSSSTFTQNAKLAAATGNFTVKGVINGTNGFAVGAQAGITCTNNVIVAGNTTNRMVWVGGILVSNIVGYSE